MSTKEGMKLAAAAIGATLGGKPLYQVVQKILPMRANWPKGPGLRFHARIVHDGLGRQIEELVIIDGRIPLTATRFYWRGTLEVSIGDRKEIICIPNPKAPEPWPIDAQSTLIPHIALPLQAPSSWVPGINLAYVPPRPPSPNR